MKILLDTDIGSDIDDALCLAYLLKQPKCELMGITTVGGEAKKRAELASAICIHAGQNNIPIYPGIELPLNYEQHHPNVPQYSRIANWRHETEFPEGEAISFMRKTIRENPGEITLLTIGPLTNAAVLFALDREIPSLLKELVIMCGRFDNGIANAPLCEWNALCDPVATSIVYHSGVPRLRSIGLDVTMQVVMTRDDMNKKFKADILKPVIDFADVWFRVADELVFHDPLAAAVIFDENICKYKRGNVEVETKSDRLMGLTHWLPDENGPVEIAYEVDKNRFFDNYFGSINL